MMKRLLLLAALLSLAVPLGARADSKTYVAPYQAGPQGGDMWNVYMTDPATGRMTVLRANPAGVSGSLGCGGSGGFSSFAVTHEAATPVTSVTVAYDDGLVDPYTFFSVSVRQGGDFLATRVVRGPIAGSGTVALTLSAPATGTLTAWFGIQVSSACPNVDGGTAKFTSVTFAG